MYLTIIPLTLVGYELSDSERGAEHRVGYHKLFISNMREWNNCFIKINQTLEVSNNNQRKHRDCILLLTVFAFSFHFWRNYRI